ncbi:MAG: sigma-54-dependent Fis family transcriptional regulator [Gammaproteobacteria bacterium]|nr:MAG: sigma-54-dependent Fis family transcriptional regulator [Gammaproteobacteria bacterium]
MASPAAESRSPQREPLLLVDDDPLILETLGFLLEEEFEVIPAASREQARKALQKLAAPPRLALVDLGLPPRPHSPQQGFALVGELLAASPGMRVLILSGQSSRENIQHALTLGAVDFIPKPCEPEVLRARIRHQQAMLEAEQQQEPAVREVELIGQSPELKTLEALVLQFAQSPFPVLIEGESGSGKELVARRLHTHGPHPEAPWLTLNCSALPADLLEAQLFGHARGAFTGASGDRTGFFEEAGEGTLFLDEIGELPLALQAKLLRVLENGEFYRLGEAAPRRSRARIVTATNRDLREEVRSGRFREDLFHRIGVLTLVVPPLRDRDGDIGLLLDHFTRLYARGGTPFELAPEARELLEEYPFPGNVRELRNIVIRLTAKYPGQRVGREQLEAELETTLLAPFGEEERASAELAAELRSPGFCLDERLQQRERDYIQAALELAGGNLSKAARMLGINRTTLYSRIQRLALRED